jgi:hypothetical protein
MVDLRGWLSLFFENRWAVGRRILNPVDDISWEAVLSRSWFWRIPFWKTVLPAELVVAVGVLV